MLQQIIQNMQDAPNYVPPMDARKLGRMMFEAGQPVDNCLSPDMRRGWFQALRAAAYADGSEYLVGQGEAVSI